MVDFRLMARRQAERFATRIAANQWPWVHGKKMRLVLKSLKWLCGLALLATLGLAA